MCCATDSGRARAPRGSSMECTYRVADADEALGVDLTRDLVRLRGEGDGRNGGDVLGDDGRRGGEGGGLLGLLSFLRDARHGWMSETRVAIECGVRRKGGCGVGAVRARCGESQRGAGECL